MEIRSLDRNDEGLVIEAAFLFDGPALASATRRFLDDSRHHLLIAYENEKPVGFVSGVEMTHPDKGTEMFLYELEVDAAHRRKGVATALVRQLEELAHERGCYGMWVITSDDNTAALATYVGAGAQSETGQTVLTWDFTVPG